jgi:hypothetical protein
MSVRSSILTRNAALDAVAPLCNGGKLRIYTGTKPATPETAAAGVLLAELSLNAAAFAPAAGGVATANAITSDPAAAATGTAGWFRIVRADGSTPVVDGDVGTSGADLNMATTSIVAGAIISCSALTLTLPQP